MARYQSGHIFEAHGAFHIWYYVTEIVDGQPKRVQRSKWLCKKDNKHHSKTCKAVKQLAATEMEKVNSESGVTQHADVSVTDFWEQTYLPQARLHSLVSPSPSAIPVSGVIMRDPDDEDWAVTLFMHRPSRPDCAMCQAMCVAGDCDKLRSPAQLALKLKNPLVLMISRNPWRQVI